MKASHHRSDEQKRQTYERTLKEYSQANRTPFSSWLRHLESKRLSNSYLMRCAGGLARLDEALNGAQNRGIQLSGIRVILAPDWQQLSTAASICRR